MKKKNLVLLFAFAVFFLNPPVVIAQKLLGKADKEFQKKNYFTCIPLYKQALKKEKDSSVIRLINFKIAESYRFGNHFSEAQNWYSKAIKSGYSNPAVYFSYADMLLINCDYDEAKIYFEKFLEANPNDEKTKMKLKSINLIGIINNEPPLYEIENKQELNSKYSDYSPVVYKDKIIFASSRFEGDSSKKYYYSYTGQGFSDFYETKYEEGTSSWKKPVKLKGGINSKFNDGTMYYDEKNNIVYFMQCNGYNGKEINCNIFCSSLDEKTNTWTEAKVFDYNNKLFSIGHPAFTSDMKKMFFVSDMPGGIGNKDIWVINKNNDGKWSEPLNLGNIINTEANEMFPYVVGDTLLYFSSDGNIGYGGLDIYYSKIKDDNFSEPVNIRAPFNSCSDDFGIVFLGNDSGLFCSNRTGGTGDDDIYSFKLLPVNITASGLITDKETKQIIPNAIVILKGTNGSVDSTLSDTTGHYKFLNIANVTYTIDVTAKKYGYLSESRTVTIPKQKYSKNFCKATGCDLDFELTKIVEEKEITIPEIYYDFDKWSLRDTSKKSLDKLVKTLNDNPKIYIRINSHTDERGSVEYNDVLSENRAQSVVNYLIEKGIDTKRLTSKGWGKSKHVVQDAKTEEEHQLNRRTTFSIVNANEVSSVYHQVQQREIEERIKVKQEIALSNEKNVSNNYTGRAVTETHILSQRRSDQVEFRVQFAASYNAPMSKAACNNIQNEITDYKIEYTHQSDGYYRYTVGSFTDLSEAKQLLKRVKKAGYPTAFITAYKGNDKITVGEAKQLLKIK
ncbi:MAG: OmpA family protein [Bacteroidales bacterium]|nr:OmpA family protein [Bacteroidales bacterium]